MRECLKRTPCVKVGMWIGVAFIGTLVSGCSSPEDKLYGAFKCGKAATLLGHGDLAIVALKNAEPFARDNGESPAKYASDLERRFEEDYPLYKYGANAQMRVLTKLYESGECRGWFSVAQRK